MTQTVSVNTAATSRNDAVARQIRATLQERGILAINLMSSPGSGKTSLLERMGERMGTALAVITGDVQMTFDADRINRSGAQAVQIETRGACHLSAMVVQKALSDVNLDGVRILVIENVGNLVCPAAYDLGERFKVAMLSVAEGDEKPAKYPALFVRAAAVIVSKIDLIPYVNFDVERAERDCRALNNAVRLFRVSCTTGEGIDQWCSYLQGAA
jgi:hydrogenase nickel incorporation protein HypB